MIGRPLNSGDVTVLAWMVIALAWFLFRMLAAIALVRPAGPMGRVSRRVATGVVVRDLGGRLGRIGRSFDGWN